MLTEFANIAPLPPNVGVPPDKRSDLGGDGNCVLGILLVIAVLWISIVARRMLHLAVPRHCGLPRNPESRRRCLASRTHRPPFL